MWYGLQSTPLRSFSLVFKCGHRRRHQEYIIFFFFFYCLYWMASSFPEIIGSMVAESSSSSHFVFLSFINTNTNKIMIMVHRTKSPELILFWIHELYRYFIIKELKIFYQIVVLNHCVLIDKGRVYLKRRMQYTRHPPNKKDNPCKYRFIIMMTRIQSR